MPNGHHDPNSPLTGHARQPDQVADAVRPRNPRNLTDVVVDARPNRPGDILDVAHPLRCGVPDVPVGDIRIQAYGPPGGRWSRTNLTYNVNVAGSRLTHAFVNAQAAAAFQQWQSRSAVVQLQADADIQIQFGGTNLNPAFGVAGGVNGRRSSKSRPSRGPNCQRQDRLASGRSRLRVREGGHAHPLEERRQESIRALPNLSVA